MGERNRKKRKKLAMGGERCKGKLRLPRERRKGWKIGREQKEEEEEKEEGDGGIAG